MCVLHLGNLQFRNLSEEEGNESVSATQVQLDLREKTNLAIFIIIAHYRDHHQCLPSLRMPEQEKQAGPGWST